MRVAEQGEPRTEFRARYTAIAMWIAAALALAAASCVHYRAVPLSPDATLDAYAARRLDAPELKSFLHDRVGIDHWPPDVWDLHALTLVALYYSPDLDVARARLAAAQAGVTTARAHPNPSLTVSEGYNSTSVGITPWIPEALLSIPIETAGKRGIRTAQARYRAETARLDVLATAWQVRRRVRRAFLDLALARERAALAAKEQTLLDETVRLLEARATAGEISANEVTQARIARDAARLGALDATQQEAQARIVLADALGVTARALDDVPLSLAAPGVIGPALPDVEARRRALTARTDILAALADYEASQAALQLEVARQYPDIDLGPGYQLDQTDSKWTLAVSLPLPVFDRNRGPIAEAAARRSEAAARFVALQAKVLAEIDGAVAACRNAASRAAAADALVADLDRRAASAEAAYRLGEISRLELVGIEREGAAGERAKLEAAAAAAEAEGTLEDAMQSPLDLKEWVLEAPLRPSGSGGGGQ